MFTGIITGLGRIVEARSATTGKRLTVQTPAGYLDDVQDGDSIAINGACMTVTGFPHLRSATGRRPARMRRRSQASWQPR